MERKKQSQPGVPVLLWHIAAAVFENEALGVFNITVHDFFIQAKYKPGPKTPKDIMLKSWIAKSRDNREDK